MESFMNKSMKKNIRHFFLLTAFAAGTIHLVNRFIDFTASMKNILKTENGNFFDWKNGKIYYTRRGSGTPVLLIHDLMEQMIIHVFCQRYKGNRGTGCNYSRGIFDNFFYKICNKLNI